MSSIVKQHELQKKNNESIILIDKSNGPSPISSIHSYSSSINLNNKLKQNQKQSSLNQKQSIIINNNNKNQIEDDQIIFTNEIYEEHRDFLAKYKKQRQQQLLKQKLQQQQLRQAKKLNLQSTPYQFQIYKQYVSDRVNNIISKVQSNILKDQEGKNKLFTEIVQTKKDVFRISKQKRFIRSQNSKYFQYSEPEMPLKSKLPNQYRIKTQSICDQSQLCAKAREFVQKVHKQQQNLLGRNLLRKKKQQRKRIIQERSILKKLKQQQFIKKQQRKIKASMNLQMLKMKVKQQGGRKQFLNSYNPNTQIDSQRNQVKRYRTQSDEIIQNFDNKQKGKSILRHRKKIMSSGLSMRYEKSNNKLFLPIDKISNSYDTQKKQEILQRKHKKFNNQHLYIADPVISLPHIIKKQQKNISENSYYQQQNFFEDSNLKSFKTQKKQRGIISSSLS